MGVPAAQRLRANSDFQEVRSLGRRVHCGPFIVNVHATVDGKSPPRLGVIASRRVGNAVKRNLGKRQVREIFRRQAASLPPGTRLVVILRSSFDRHAFADLEARFHKMVMGLQIPDQPVDSGGPLL